MAKKTDPISIHITPTSIVAAAAVGLGIWLFFYLKDLFLIVLTAIVIASSIEPAVLWFMKHRVIRPAAVALVYFIIFGFLFGFAYLLFPPLIQETAGFVATLPQYISSFNLEEILTSPLVTATREVAQVDTTSLAETLRQFGNIFTSTGEGAFRAVSSVFGGVFSFFLIMLLSFYFAIQETGIDDFLRIIVPVRHQKYAVSLWRRSQIKIGQWMQGQLLLSLIVAVLTYLWLTILGVPYALLLAIFAAIAELVPVFGSLAAAVPAILVAATVGGIPMAFLAGGGYLVINQIQGNLIYPLVVKRVVGVPPLLVILALIAGAQLAGFLGVLLSVPIAAALKELISDIQKQKIAEAKQFADEEGMEKKKGK
ncbi:MAG: AI-2E family transporter [Patescibacteria group bacterium UBA2163]